jgi:hypothetical protein
MTADGAAIQGLQHHREPGVDGWEGESDHHDRIEESITRLDDNKRLTPRRQRVVAIRWQVVVGCLRRSCCWRLEPGKV